MIKKVGATALLFCLLALDRANAGFFDITPAPPPPAPPPGPPLVPEFDGAGSIAAIALLASIVALLYSRSKNRGVHAPYRCGAHIPGVRNADDRPCTGYGLAAISASLAMVFMLRAVPDLAAGILSLERPMPSP